MDRVVIGAMARSGSTWAFNAARLLATEIYGRVHVNASDIANYVEVPDVKIEILKSHDITSAWAPVDKIITCVRDIRDAFCSGVAAQLMEIESYNRRGLCKGVFTGIDLLFADPSFAWIDQAGLTIRFEDMTINKVGTLEKIGHYLFPTHPFTLPRLQRIAIKLEVLPELYEDFDPEQGYLYGRQRHRQHIGIGGYHQRLPYADVVCIESAYAPWFDRFNYAVGEAYEIDEIYDE